jgi:Transmembrane secretion effector
VLFVTGLAGIVTVTGCNTALQLGAPDELRGRVMSLYTWVYGGVFPFGSFLVGATSERHGVSAALLLKRHPRPQSADPAGRNPAVARGGEGAQIARLRP